MINGCKLGAIDISIQTRWLLLEHTGSVRAEQIRTPRLRGSEPTTEPPFWGDCLHFQALYNENNPEIMKTSG